MAREDRVVTVDGEEWEVPNAKEWWGSRTGSTGKKIIEAIQKNGGKPLTESQLRAAMWSSGPSLFGAADNLILTDKEKQFYYDILDANSNKLGYTAEQVYRGDDGVMRLETYDPDKFNLEDIKTENSNISNSTSSASASDYESMVEAAYEDRLNLMTDVNGTNAQRFRDTMYGAIAEEQAVAEQSLGQAELDAYRMLGQQQLELENTIAEQRKKALVSGTTSAQLAAGQLQNMFAAQSGAAQVAQSLANQRTQMNQTFAEKRTGVETSLYDYINQQQTIAATAGAQNLAALSSYASYANKNYNDMMSLYKAKQDMGTSAYNKLIQDIYGKEK